mgnify:CR=1 FL=1
MCEGAEWIASIAIQPALTPTDKNGTSTVLKVPDEHVSPSFPFVYRYAVLDVTATAGLPTAFVVAARDNEEDPQTFNRTVIVSVTYKDFTSTVLPCE